MISARKTSPTHSLHSFQRTVLEIRVKGSLTSRSRQFPGQNALRSMVPGPWNPLSFLPWPHRVEAAVPVVLLLCVLNPPL